MSHHRPTKVTPQTRRRSKKDTTKDGTLSETVSSFMTVALTSRHEGTSWFELVAQKPQVSRVWSSNTTLLILSLSSFQILIGTSMSTLSVIESRHTLRLFYIGTFAGLIFATVGLLGGGASKYQTPCWGICLMFVSLFCCFVATCGMGITLVLGLTTSGGITYTNFSVEERQAVATSIYAMTGMCVAETLLSAASVFVCWKTGGNPFVKAEAQYKTREKKFDSSQLEMNYHEQEGTDIDKVRYFKDGTPISLFQAPEGEIAFQNLQEAKTQIGTRRATRVMTSHEWVRPAMGKITERRRGEHHEPKSTFVKSKVVKSEKYRVPSPKQLQVMSKMKQSLSGVQPLTEGEASVSEKPTISSTIEYSGYVETSLDTLPTTSAYATTEFSNISSETAPERSGDIGVASDTKSSEISSYVGTLWSMFGEPKNIVEASTYKSSESARRPWEEPPPEVSSHDAGKVRVASLLQESSSRAKPGMSVEQFTQQATSLGVTPADSENDLPETHSAHTRFDKESAL